MLRKYMFPSQKISIRKVIKVWKRVLSIQSYNWWRMAFRDQTDPDIVLFFRQHITLVLTIRSL
jgi:hypothetical protein